MARRRRSTPTTPEARDLALTIRQGERLGLSQRAIADTLGIDPRTVRKIKSGQTSGTRTRARIMHLPKKARQETGLFNAEFVVGLTTSGDEVIASTNIRVANIRTASGETRAPTPLDVFRVRGLATVVAQERLRRARQYGNIASAAPTGNAVRLRAISRARRSVHVIRTNA